MLMMVSVCRKNIFWLYSDLCLLGWEYKFNQEHKHGSLPGLTWVSTDNEQDITTQVAHFAHLNCWETISRLSWANVDEDLLSQIYNFDFLSGPNDDVDYLVNWFHKQVNFHFAIYLITEICPGSFKYLCPHRAI